MALGLLWCCDEVYQVRLKLIFILLRTAVECKVILCAVFVVM